MKIFSTADFKNMPWKNGAGSTCELFRIPDPEDRDQFVFRLSKAQIVTSGPFSFYPGIDRTLCLIAGNGLKLNGKELTLKHRPISFTGEEAIQCELVDGPCVDFNVMVKRKWGKAEVEVLSLNAGDKIKASFIYLPSLDHLVQLDPSETWPATAQVRAIAIRMSLTST